MRFLIENLILFLRAVVNFPTQTPIISPSLISQDNHLTAGVWATCGCLYFDS